MIVDEPMATAEATAAATAAAPTVPGVRNFRDAGGTGALPRGVLYRSGALDRLTPDGARTLRGLGVRTVLDLRSAPEVADRPDALGGSGIRYLHVPVFAERRWPHGAGRAVPADGRAGRTARDGGRPAVAASGAPRGAGALCFRQGPHRGGGRPAAVAAGRAGGRGHRRLPPLQHRARPDRRRPGRRRSGRARTRRPPGLRRPPAPGAALRPLPPRHPGRAPARPRRPGRRTRRPARRVPAPVGGRAHG